MGHVNVLSTPRLELVAIESGLADALLDRDVVRAAAWLGAARFPEPFALPPLLDEDLAQFATTLRERPDEAGWWGWLAVETRARAIVGFAIATRPDEQGCTMLGWSVYLDAQGRGYATEAAGGVLAWAFATGRVRRAVATIPPSLAASRRVAEKLGMRRIGSERHPEAGDVDVYELQAGNPL